MAKRYPLGGINLEFLKSKVLRHNELITSYDIPTGVVKTSAAREIMRKEEVLDCGEYGLVELYIQDFGLLSNPPPPKRGAAVLEDGSTFYLCDRLDFRRFFTRLVTTLKPVDVARLLVMFQTEDLQELVEGPLGDSFDEAKAHPLLLHTPLVKSASPLSMEFCSSLVPLHQRPTLFRWEVFVTQMGLEWTTKMIWEKKFPWEANPPPAPPGPGGFPTGS